MKSIYKKTILIVGMLAVYGLWLYQTPTQTTPTYASVSCPVPSPIQVEPVPPANFLGNQVLFVSVDIGGAITNTSTITVSTVSGAFATTIDGSDTQPAPIAVTLLPTTSHALTVTTVLERAGCPNITQTTTTDKNGAPLFIETVAPQDIPTDTPILLNRTDDGRVSLHMASIFGPHICTGYGDPFAPFNSAFRPVGDGMTPYTYRYQIRIPTDYPDDVVRVELFDPDSINAVTNTALVTHTNTAVAQGDPMQEGLSCSSSDRRNSCYIHTGESSYVGSNGIVVDDINPFWFMRVDDNRGAGAPPGNGNCGIPVGYSPEYMTQTRYDLFYHNESGQAVALASYTGQTGDGVRDAGEHQTDLRWVSPGAPNSFGSDISGTVPVDAGSPSTFQVDLNNDVANIQIDPITGDRLLQLHVTTLSGGSENGFAIWAGPDDYVTTMPSNVNLRNVQIVNDPSTHSAQGVTVEAINFMPMNTNWNNRQEIRLLDIPAEYAGETVYVSLFDIDTGVAPPIEFYFDSISRDDWELTFAVNGVTDPDGVPDGMRCKPGNCNNQWVNPMYAIEIPGDLAQCDWQNPTGADCIPFTGGTLMVSYDGGYGDTLAWHVQLPDPQTVHDFTQSCASMPIGAYIDMRSVTPTGTGSTPYPDTSQFTHPIPGPTYDSFTEHVPDLPLATAQKGSVYYLDLYDSAWFLLWNGGKPGSAATLADSLTWPGDSSDYTDHGDTSIYPAAAEYSHIVRGYVQPFDYTDLTLRQKRSWIPMNLGLVSTTSVRTILNEHIDTQRILRLPIIDEVMQSGTNGRVRTYGFARFRLQGYRLHGSSSTHWLLATFEGWEESCGFLPLQLHAHHQNGQVSFTAELNNTDVLSTTFIWENLAGATPVIGTGMLTDSQPFTNEAAGLHVMEVTAVSRTTHNNAVRLPAQATVFVYPLVAGTP